MLGAEDGVAQVHLDGRLRVVARDRLGGGPPRARTPAAAEEVLEHRAQVGGVESRVSAGESLEPGAPAAEVAGLTLDLARFLLSDPSD